MKKFTVVDLFCGAGGLSLGLELSKHFRVVGAIDHWLPAIETFRYNHPHIPAESIVHGNLLDIFDEHKSENLLSKWGFPEQPVDVVVGGPPCQGMSLAGKRLSNDPRNQLFKCFVEMVRRLQPRIFIMENVPGLLSADGGRILRVILDAFKGIEYNHFYDHQPEILKSETYGAPQIRRRLFFIGFPSDGHLKSITWPPPQTHCKFSHTNELLKNSGQFPLFDGRNGSLKDAVTVKQAISDLPKLKSGEGSDVMDYPESNEELTEFQFLMRDWSSCPEVDRERKIFNHESPNHTAKMIDMIKIASPGQSVDPKYSDSKKWDPDKPGFTVKALGAGGGSTNRRAFHYDPETPRGSTVRENARIQSFPDWYRFLGPKTHQMTQVGNAVPPLLALSIAKVVAEVLNSE